jgi:glutamate-ammonia-ligase adenylyltransferase
MIDELMDGLMLEKLPEFHQQETALADLCKGAEDIDPIVHSFHNAQTLRVGVGTTISREGPGNDSP